MLVKKNLAIAILIILYTVGIVGFLLPIDKNFPLLTPLNLVLSCLLIIPAKEERAAKTFFFLRLCFVVGLLAEMIGVNTGLIFGSYTYGPVLGYQILGTPIMIGINWAMLSYCAGVSINSLLKNSNWILKSLAGATLMVLLDVLIEPVAMHYDFWQWGNNIVPIQNYIAWFSISLVLLLVFNKILGHVVNKAAIVLFILQFVFFGILYLVILKS